MKEINLYKKMENDKRIMGYKFGKKFISNQKEINDLPFKISNEETLFLPFNKCSLTINNNSIITIEHIETQPYKSNSVYKFSIIILGENNAINIFKGYFIPCTLKKENNNKIYNFIDKSIKKYVNEFIVDYELDKEYNSIVVFTYNKHSFNKNMKLKKYYKNEDEKDEIMNDILKSVSRGVLLTTLYFKSFIVDTKKFVVEINNGKKGKKGLKINKHKSLFKIINIKDIRKEYINGKESIGNGKKLINGFERRRHRRTYRNNRYVNMKGKTVIIESTWIGPSTNIIGETLYKVRLDVGSEPKEN